jgi:hypothetical protein
VLKFGMWKEKLKINMMNIHWLVEKIKILINFQWWKSF